MVSFNKNFYGSMQNSQIKNTEINDPHKLKDKVSELTQSLGREMEAVRVKKFKIAGIKYK